MGFMFVLRDALSMSLIVVFFLFKSINRGAMLDVCLYSENIELNENASLRVFGHSLMPPFFSLKSSLNAIHVGDKRVQFVLKIRFRELVFFFLNHQRQQRKLSD